MNRETFWYSILWIEWNSLIQYIVNRVKHSDSLLWIEWNILIQYIVNRVKHSDTVLWIEWNILLWKEWSFIFVMNCVWIVRQLTGPWKQTHCSGPILHTSVAEFSDSTVDSLLDFNCCLCELYRPLNLNMYIYRMVKFTTLHLCVLITGDVAISKVWQSLTGPPKRNDGHECEICVVQL